MLERFRQKIKRPRQKKSMTELEIAQREYELQKELEEKGVETKKVPSTKKNNYPILLACFTLGIIGTGYLISPYGRINEILIESDSMVPEQIILDASSITNKQTMVGTYLNEAEIEQNIQSQLPQIKSVSFQWQGVNDLILQVKSYETIAYMEDENSYHSVIETGEVLTEEHHVPLGNKPLLKNFEAGPILDQFITSYKKIGEEIKNSISEISYTGTKKNPYTITLFMNDGNQVKANLRDFADKITYYPSILPELAEQKGIIDMEVGVYFTPFEEKPTPE